MSNYNSRGFTLLETMIYLAIFTAITLTMANIVYGLIRDISRTRHHVVVIEEQNFIVAKLNWMLSNAAVIVMESPTTLVATTHTSTFVIHFEHDHIQAQGLSLNSDDVAVVLSGITIIPSQGRKPSGVMLYFSIDRESVTSINYASQ